MKDWIVIGVAFVLGMVGVLGGAMLARAIWPCDCGAVVGASDTGGLDGTGLLILGPGDAAVCNPFASPLAP